MEKLLQLTHISKIELKLFNENEAYLCIDKFGTPAFITGKSLKETFHPEVHNVLMPIENKFVTDNQIKEYFELSESQCQDPYCIAKQAGQIEGAKWARYFESPDTKEKEAITFHAWLHENTTAHEVHGDCRYYNIGMVKLMPINELYMIFEQSKLNYQK